jgi:dynein heavy chain
LFRNVALTRLESIVFAQTRDKFLLLWYHESVRVFSDRLIDDEDREWCHRFLQNTLNETFKYNIDDVIGKEPLFYGDFCDVTGEYEQITDMAKVIRQLIKLPVFIIALLCVLAF